MLSFESYKEHERHLPSEGKFIIAHFNKESVVIYQAFKDSIAEYAVANQRFGGADYDFGRMTWLKPSFLWMMYYSGWAKKENQENVLAIRVKRSGFDEMLQAAITETFYKSLYDNRESWKDKLDNSEVHLRWQPYYDLFGEITDRRAVMIGLKGRMLERYNNEWIEEIINITPYIKEQQAFLKADKTGSLFLPKERVYAPNDLSLLTRIDATTISM